MIMVGGCTEEFLKDDYLDNVLGDVDFNKLRLISVLRYCIDGVDAVNSIISSELSHSKKRELCSSFIVTHPEVYNLANRVFSVCTVIENDYCLYNTFEEITLIVVGFIEEDFIDYEGVKRVNAGAKDVRLRRRLPSFPLYCFLKVKAV